ncbi:sulfotransferase domain-containing protein [Actinomadura flavalba]|uniref:sulfotransferase domain-containing protein n=1 Tax=Actinomadura flavalba TaxID=1120938 RepID=UPI00037A0404|nr:sulfotransferase domain-containing protein [Actinomadura flavalba]
MSGGRPKVLYITGMTRCGSTMLGNVLNEVPGVVHIGELHYLWRNGILRSGTNSTCGCGGDLGECPMWSVILDRASVPTSQDAARLISRIQDRHLRHRDTPARLAEARFGLPAPAGVRRVLDVTADIYRALAEQPGVELIVDSSKYPAEAAALSGRDDLDLRVLHMVRDPRATAYSYSRSKKYIDAMPPARSTATWSAVNLASDLIGLPGALPGDRFTRVRHEDFGRDPRGVVAGVLAFAGVRGPNPVDDGTVELTGNHTVTGNPDRLETGAVAIRADERWRTDLDWKARAVTTAAAAPQLLRYGYGG